MKIKKVPLPIHTRILGVLLFWTHFGLMMWYTLAGFFYSLEVIVIALLLIQLHLIIFGGCAITQLQHRLEVLPKDQEFIPYFVRRVFGIKMPEQSIWSDIIWYLLMSFPLIVWLLRFYFL